MAPRSQVARRIAELAGPDVLRITDAGTGWPTEADLVVDGRRRPVALHAAPVTLSKRNRDDRERRFQNPGSDRPILDPGPPRVPLLVGLWEDDPFVDGPPLLVFADPYRRMGRTTRVSIFVGLGGLVVASARGWSVDSNTAGEPLRCMLPELMPIAWQIERAEAAPDADLVQAVIQGSGLLDAAPYEVPAAADRARRGASALVRDARFARRVLAAYGGRCAMCGLGTNLVQAAHIYPVAAPGSPDEPWNGLALCANHHLAFDRHFVVIDPETLEVTIDPVLLERARADQPLASFVESTQPRLSTVRHASAHPRPEMFRARYEFHGEAYEWAVL